MTELRAGNRRLLMVDNYDSFTCSEGVGHD